MQQTYLNMHISGPYFNSKRIIYNKSLDNKAGINKP